MPLALIVEDEPQANKLLSMLVQLHGYTTESAFCGVEALEKVQALGPDVVFLDLMLPDLDGYAVCRALKASGTTSQIPVVIVTARIAAENRIESFQAGADDYVPKPYTPDQIFKALDEAAAIPPSTSSPAIEGRVVLDGRDDGDTLRHLARLRGMLLARSGLDHTAIDQIVAAIRAIWSGVDGWTRRTALGRGGDMTYRLSPESLTLTIHDEGGWLSSVGKLNDGALPAILAEARFDKIEIDQDNRCLRLVKQFEVA